MKKTRITRSVWIIGIISCICMIVDVFLSLTTPASAVTRKLGLGNDIARFILSVTFTIPIFLSLFFGMWSSLILSGNIVAEEKEKRGFRLFGLSILTQTLVVVIALIMGAIRTHFFSGNFEGGYRIITVLDNWIYSFGYLLGFALLLYATYLLMQKKLQKWNIFLGALCALVIGVFYIIVLFTNPDRQMSTIPGTAPSQYLSDFFILFTIALPTIVSWFLGITAAFSLADIYSIPAQASRQDALRTILQGNLLTIFSVIMLEALLSVGTARFLQGGLGFILIVLYAFIFAMAAGNYLLLRGVVKLTKE